MTALSDRMESLASRMATKYGAAATLTRRTPSTFNPATQTDSGATTTTDSVDVVLTDFRAHEIDGDTIRYGDKKILVPKSDLQNLLEPKPDDIITVNSTNYRIVNLMGLSGGDRDIGYIVQGRK